MSDTFRPMDGKTRITVFLDRDLVEKLSRLTSQIGVSRDFLLSSTLPSELGYLHQLQSNGPRATRWFRALSKSRTNKQRLNLTMSEKDAAAMNRLCAEKGITRDQFVSEYVSFLVDGDPQGSCVSPLQKVAAILDDPRFEFSSNPVVHPYDNLHLTEDDASKIDTLLRELMDGSGKSADASH